MQVLTRADLNEWFGQFADRTEGDVHFDDGGPFFTHSEAGCIDLEYPSKLERLPFFARYLATVGKEPMHFSGAMLWFEDWAVWNELDAGIGYRIVENFNRAYGQPISFEEAPAHSFRADELLEAVGLLLQPMTFGWDAFYVPRWSYGYDEFFLYVSHDSFVSIVTRTKEFYERVFADLQGLNLNPTVGNERRVSRFCRQR